MASRFVLVTDFINKQVVIVDTKKQTVYLSLDKETYGQQAQQICDMLNAAHEGLVYRLVDLEEE